MTNRRLARVTKSCSSSREWRSVVLQAGTKLTTPAGAEDALLPGAVWSVRIRRGNLIYRKTHTVLMIINDTFNLIFHVLLWGVATSHFKLWRITWNQDNYLIRSLEYVMISTDLLTHVNCVRHVLHFALQEQSPPCGFDWKTATTHKKQPPACCIMHTVHL